MLSGMVEKITKAGGTNAGTGGTFVPPVKCLTSYTVKICPAKRSRSTQTSSNIYYLL